MAAPARCIEPAPPTDPAPPDECPPDLLPSGRSVVVKVRGDREELEIRSPQGEVEVRIVLTEGGPVVSLRGGRLELESPDEVALNCRRFEVKTTEGIDLRSAADVSISTGQEMRLKAERDVRVEGKPIRLN